MSSSTTSSLIANRKGSYSRSGSPSSDSPTMKARSALVQHRAATAEWQVRRTALQVVALPIPANRSVKICCAPGTVPAFARSLGAPILSRLES